MGGVPLSEIDQQLRIGIEQGGKRTFASALDWPGWCRSAKTPDEAIDALVDYRDRYNEMLSVGRIQHIPADVSNIRVVQKVAGSATTAFAPDKPFDVENEPLAGKDLERYVRIVRASWNFLDMVARDVSEELQKGLRGGGRNRSKLLAHVLEAERSYVRYVDVKVKAMDIDDLVAIADFRDQVITAIERFGESGEATPRKWSLRYFIRRMVWHTLDHAWEMQDKDLTGEEQT